MVRGGGGILTATLWDAFASLDESVAAARAKGKGALGFFDIERDDVHRTTLQVLRLSQRHFQGLELALFMFEIGIAAGYRLCQLRRLEEEV